MLMSLLLPGRFSSLNDAGQVSRPQRLVAVVDGHPEMANATCHLVGEVPRHRPLGPYFSTEDFLRKSKRLFPHVILVRLEEFDAIALERIQGIKRSHPKSDLLVSVACENKQFVYQLLRAGAVGLIKDHFEELKGALDELGVGGAPLSTSYSAFVTQYYHAHENKDLTPRELETMSLLSRGLSYSEIATAQSVSKLTVKSRLKNIYKKLHVRRKSKAIALTFGGAN